MTQQAVIDSFTTDEEIDHWVIGDDTIELRGYVDEVVGMRDVAVGRVFNERVIMLLKIIINNSSHSRICVLFWGDRAIQYSENLPERCIITIERAKAQERSPKFHNPEDGVGPIELSITRASTIFIENFLFHPRRLHIPPQIVTIGDAPNMPGRLCVFGWLKVIFTRVVSAGNMFGSGVIVNGKYGLQLRVLDYQVPITFPRGTYVRVLCESVEYQGLYCLAVRSSEDVIQDNTQLPLIEAVINTLGFVTPTRQVNQVVNALPQP